MLLNLTSVSDFQTHFVSDFLNLTFVSVAESHRLISSNKQISCSLVPNSKRLPCGSEQYHIAMGDDRVVGSENCAQLQKALCWGNGKARTLLSCVPLSMATEKTAGIRTLLVAKAQHSRWWKVIATLGTGGEACEMMLLTLLLQCAKSGGFVRLASRTTFLFY